MTVSLLGDGIYLVAIAWQTYELSNAPTALSIVGVAWTLPIVLFVLIGGVLSDRFDRRRIMILSDAIRALAIGTIGVLSLSGSLELWNLVLLVAVYGAGEALFVPSFQAIVPDLVPFDLLVQANSLDSLIRTFAGSLVGPALGGLAVAALGAGSAFLLDAGTFVVSAVFLLAIRARFPRAERTEETSIVADVREGYRFVRSLTWLWGSLMAATFVLLFFFGPSQVLLPYVVKNELHGSSADFGLALAAAGLGSIGAAIVIGGRALPKRFITVMYVGWTFATGMIAFWGLATGLWQIMVASVLRGVGITVSMVIWTTLIQTRVPRELLGRVWSFDWMLSLALIPVSFALTGPIAAALGARETLVAAGVLGGATTLAFLFFLPGLRATRAGGRSGDGSGVRSASVTIPPPPTADRAAAAKAREQLRQAGYDREGIQRALRVGGELLTRAADRPVYLRRLTGDGPLEALIRLFLLDETVPAEEAERALAPDGPGPLVELGLLGETDAGLQALARVVPHGAVFVASDLSSAEAGFADFVAAVHRPSVTLADLTIRRPVARALDMATGNGIQAILAAELSERVIATDLNERALAFAETNAALNGVDNIEFRHGSFFEPVAGETFGLVVSNPPYVISPENDYLFRDSGLGRDRVSERLAGELPGYIEEGGFGTMMASWVQAGDDFTARPASWLDGLGCDVWVLHTAVDDPLTTAAAWNRYRASDEEEYAAAIDRWRDYFAEEGIEAVAYGAILVRRRSGAANWARTRELPAVPRERPVAHVMRLFTGVDAAESLADDAAVQRGRFALVEGALIERRLRRDPSGWAEAASLTTTIGIPFSAELDGFTATFLTQLDGTRPLGEVVTSLAEAFDAPADRLLASGSAIARELLELGLAEVVSGS